MTKAEEVVPVPINDTPDQHELEHVWVFWYLIPNRSGQTNNWGEYLHPLHSFQTIEGFRRILNSIEHPGKLLKGCRYYIFRDKIKPLWEDPGLNGGKQVSLEIEKTNDNGQEIEDKWIDIVEMALKEQFGDNHTIVGIELNSRVSTWKMALWVSSNCNFLNQIQDKMGIFVGNGELTVSSLTDD